MGNSFLSSLEKLKATTDAYPVQHFFLSAVNGLDLACRQFHWINFFTLYTKPFFYSQLSLALSLSPVLGGKTRFFKLFRPFNWYSSRVHSFQYSCCYNIITNNANNENLNNAFSMICSERFTEMLCRCIQVNWINHEHMLAHNRHTVSAFYFCSWFFISVWRSDIETVPILSQYSCNVLVCINKNWR